MSELNKLRVSVDAVDIALGQKRDCLRCPIAGAINKMFHEFPEALVCNHFATISVGNHRYQYLLPTDASRFIAYFDENLTVTPFTFEMSLVK